MKNTLLTIEQRHVGSKIIIESPNPPPRPHVTIYDTEIQPFTKTRSAENPTAWSLIQPPNHQLPTLSPAKHGPGKIFHVDHYYDPIDAKRGSHTQWRIAEPHDSKHLAGQHAYLQTGKRYGITFTFELHRIPKTWIQLFQIYSHPFHGETERVPVVAILLKPDNRFYLETKDEARGRDPFSRRHLMQFAQPFANDTIYSVHLDIACGYKTTMYAKLRNEQTGTAAILSDIGTYGYPPDHNDGHDLRYGIYSKNPKTHPISATFHRISMFTEE